MIARGRRHDAGAGHHADGHSLIGVTMRSRTWSIARPHPDPYETDRYETNRYETDRYETARYETDRRTEIANLIAIANPKRSKSDRESRT